MASVDPRAVGERLLGMRERFRSPLLSELADNLPWHELAAYDDADSTARDAHRRYHDELQERARCGDKYAISLLLGNHNDDPGGS